MVLLRFSYNLGGVAVQLQSWPFGYLFVFSLAYNGLLVRLFMGGLRLSCGIVVLFGDVLRRSSPSPWGCFAWPCLFLVFEIGYLGVA